MTGWTPRPDALPPVSPEDEALVRALRTRHTDALTQVYDRYGPQLFDYCHALLRDEPYASRVLHDILLAAQAHVERLRSPAQLRGWLYALARRECQRILSGPDRPVQRRPAPETPDRFASPEERRRYHEARLLAHDALRALTGRQREAVDLTLRHGLTDTELAGVLGVPPEEAAALAEGSRDELADAVESRVGHRRIQLGRLMAVLPSAMAPPNLEQRVLASVLDPGMEQDRAQIARRALPFDARGWPCEEAARQGHRAPEAAVTRVIGAGRTGEKPKTPSVLWPLAGAAAVAMLMGGLFLLRPDEGLSDPQAADTSRLMPEYTDEPVDGEEPTDEPSPEKTAVTKTPAKTPSQEPPSPSASPSTTTPTKKPTPSSTPSTTKPAATPKPGKLLFSSAACVIAYPARTCTVTITASGGPVKWSASGYDNVRGGGSGTLADGQSRMLLFRVVRDDPCLEGELAVPFTPAGSVQVAWDCPPPVEEEPPAPGEDPGNGDGPQPV
ncbi:sigma-70 family RNA polymerase sigma factor [Actinocorallia libanotica]|uniref:RNA polymerase sigma-70 region 2 domain-containing protein n=1 Tax=Actinocorallia libanotica TaxID=46162 RepID=A0ABP4B5Y3_9ACTN